MFLLKYVKWPIVPFVVHAQSCVKSDQSDFFSILKMLDLKKIVHQYVQFAETDVTFWVYSRKAQPVELNLEKHKKVLTTKPLKFIVHGYCECKEKEHYQEMVKEYHKKGDYTIVIVDWSVPAEQQYPMAAYCVKPVGVILGSLLVQLYDQYDLKLEKVHLIGHSLGAHIAGFAGKEFTKRTSQKLPRITSLDPAGPLFNAYSQNKDERLSDEDAEMVDVLYTDIGLMGYKGGCMGTVEFLANGGRALQPGCGLPDLREIIQGNQESVYCSHHRSYWFFAEAINSKKFVATRCSSWNNYKKGCCKNGPKVTYGDNLPKGITGRYYFRTNANKPYGKGEDKD